MNIPLFSLLRKGKKVWRGLAKQRAGRFLSPCRRIERVCLAERVCAMTFDDGPCALPYGNTTLTGHLLDTLAAYNAHATFDVIGYTGENYPDTPGAEHGHFVFGVQYDHYACFGQDHLAGVHSQPELTRRIVAEGHELANHGYRHILFGPNRSVYRSRKHFQSLDEALADLRRLHELVFSLTGFTMRLARPPHYIDAIPGGHSAYDAYAAMGYQYMAASFDGGGWLPTVGDGSSPHPRDVEAMVQPLRTLLQENPDALCGQIIFQKDGLNMSRQAPIGQALAQQLELLSQYGYRVVGVGELLRMSPFEDLSPEDPCFEAARSLTADGILLAYRNNTFQPDRPMTRQALRATGQKDVGDWEAFVRRYPTRRQAAIALAALS